MSHQEHFFLENMPSVFTLGRFRMMSHNRPLLKFAASNSGEYFRYLELYS